MRRLRLAWPVDNTPPGTHFWGNQVLGCLRSNGVRIEFEEIAQEPGFVVRTRVTKAGATHMIAFDNNDDP